MNVGVEIWILDGRQWRGVKILHVVCIYDSIARLDTYRTDGLLELIYSIEKGDPHMYM